MGQKPRFWYLQRLFEKEVIFSPYFFESEMKFNLILRVDFTFLPISPLGGGLLASEVGQVEDILRVYTGSGAISRTESELDEVVGKRTGRSARSSSCVCAYPCDEYFDVTLIWTNLCAVTEVNGAVLPQASRVVALRLRSTNISVFVACTGTFTASVDPSQRSNVSTIHLYHELVRTDGVERRTRVSVVKFFGRIKTEATRPDDGRSGIWRRRNCKLGECCAVQYSFCRVTTQ